MHGFRGLGTRGKLSTFFLGWKHVFSVFIGTLYQKVFKSTQTAEDHFALNGHITLPVAFPYFVLF